MSAFGSFSHGQPPPYAQQQSQGGGRGRRDGQPQQRQRNDGGHGTNRGNHYNDNRGQMNSRSGGGGYDDGRGRGGGNRSRRPDSNRGQTRSHNNSFQRDNQGNAFGTHQDNRHGSQYQPRSHGGSGAGGQPFNRNLSNHNNDRDGRRQQQQHQQQSFSHGGNNGHGLIDDRNFTGSNSGANVFPQGNNGAGLIPSSNTSMSANSFAFGTTGGSVLDGSSGDGIFGSARNTTVPAPRSAQTGMLSGDASLFGSASGGPGTGMAFSSPQTSGNVGGGLLSQRVPTSRAPPPAYNTSFSAAGASSSGSSQPPAYQPQGQSMGGSVFGSAPLLSSATSANTNDTGRGSSLPRAPHTSTPPSGSLFGAVKPTTAPSSSPSTTAVSAPSTSTSAKPFPPAGATTFGKTSVFGTQPPHAPAPSGGSVFGKLAATAAAPTHSAFGAFSSGLPNHSSFQDASRFTSSGGGPQRRDRDGSAKEQYSDNDNNDDEEDMRSERSMDGDGAHHYEDDDGSQYDDDEEDDGNSDGGDYSQRDEDEASEEGGRSGGDSQEEDDTDNGGDDDNQPPSDGGSMDDEGSQKDNDFENDERTASDDGETVSVDEEGDEFYQGSDGDDDNQNAYASQDDGNHSGFYSEDHDGSNRASDNDGNDDYDEDDRARRPTAAPAVTGTTASAPSAFGWTKPPSVNSALGNSTTTASPFGGAAAPSSFSSVFGAVRAAPPSALSTTRPSPFSSFPSAAAAPAPTPSPAAPSSLFGAATTRATAAPKRQRPNTPPQDGLHEEQGRRFPIPAPRHESAAAPHHAPLPARAEQYTGGVAPLPSSSGAAVLRRQPHRVDTRAPSQAAVLFRSFVVKLAKDDARERAWQDMDEAFFSDKIMDSAAFRMRADFSYTVDELMVVWEQERKRMPTLQSPQMRGDMWIALFALGCQANLILQALAMPRERVAASHLAHFIAAVQANPIDALTDACAFANQMNDLTVELYQHEADMRTPYAILPTILTRVRTTFDEACAWGAFRVGSNMRPVTSKVFSVLIKKLKPDVMKSLGKGMRDPASSVPAHMLICEKPRDLPLVMSFAALVYEIRMSEAPFTPDIVHFAEAFHYYYRGESEARCLLYFSEACQLIQQPLSMAALQEAADRLASAVATLPDADAEPAAGGSTSPSTHTDGGAMVNRRTMRYVVEQNRRILFIYLTAVNLALGNIPETASVKAFHVPELADAMVAMRSANLHLFDIALQNNSIFFVEAGIYNVMMAARERLALLLVVKFYLARQCANRIDVTELVSFFGFPYSPEEVLAVWLLPLLVKKQLNGVLDHLTLVLSNVDPFDGFSKQALLEAAQAEFGASPVPS